MFRFSRSSLDRRAGIDPRLIEIDDLALSLSKIDFGHPEYAGFRTTEDQQEMYKRGVSQLDGVTGRSLHQDGLALDFYAFVDGKASWHPPHLAMVAAAFLQAASELGVSLEWGGLWSTNQTIDFVQYGWDCGHVQLKAV